MLHHEIKWKVAEYYCLWLALLYALLPVHLIAQPNPEAIESRHYFMRDGLADEGLTDVLQDDQGFLWLSTGSGLHKFDGYEFTSYQNDPRSANSLRNNAINCLWMDRKGMIWVGHDEGLDIFDPASNRFFFHWIDSLFDHNGLNIKVVDVSERLDGMVWVCTNRGIYVADPQRLIIKKVEYFPDEEVYNEVVETRDGSTWAATTSGLMHVEKDTEKITIYRNDPSDTTTLSNNLVKTVFLDRKNQLWVGTARGFNKFNPVSRSFRRYLTRLDVTTFFEHSDGTMLVGTEYGVGRFDRTTGLDKRITGSYYTFTIFKDRQGVIWLATLQGLHQINPQIKKFKTHLEFDNNIGYVVEDENHQIWMSTFRGVFRFDQGLRNPAQVKKTTSDLSNLVHSIHADRNGSIWFGSNGTIERYDLGNQTTHTIKIPEESSIMALLVDSEGNVWIGTRNNVGRYVASSNAYENRTDFPKTAVHHIHEDVHKNVWMATSAGLARYNLPGRKLDIFKNDPDDPNSISNNTIYHILEQNDGTLWLATDGGLNRITPGTSNNTPVFEHWRTANSDLPHNNVYQIIDGHDGTLWLSAGNMISHFDLAKNTFRNYDEKAGLPGKDIKEGWFHGRGLRASNGQIFFGTGYGLIAFHPDSLADNTYVPPVVITAFSVHNQPLAISGASEDSNKSMPVRHDVISRMRDMILEYDQNDFNFEFAALNYINSENNQYKYRLEPYEYNWTTTNARNRVARYTNINPGTYTFRVIASNNDGVWNEVGTSMGVIILPPWWQTWWAYSIYSLLVLMSLVYWRRFENNRVRLKHRAKHLSELDALKTRFFTNISHEFRTPTTLILGPLKKLYNKASGEDKEEIGLMMRNGQRLLRLINQLLDLGKIEAGKMELRTTRTELVQFLREIAASYESLAKARKIKYMFYQEMHELWVYIDNEKIDKVVHNLLSNALKFTKAGGEVILNLRQETSNFVVTVTDTGIGIPTDQQEKIFDRFHQADNSQTRGYEGSGLGMALSKEFVELHKGKISVQSVEGKGSSFTVMIPVGREQVETTEAVGPSSNNEAEMLSDTFVTAAPVSENGSRSSDDRLVLIVEDNPDMRSYIRKTLADQYQIVEAHNGKAGLEFAQETIPDLIISDIMMPEMDGYKLCALVKSNELTSHIPVILLTAKADRESKLSGLETGADDYLSKPFDSDELRLIVRNRIEERRRMRDRFSREITLEPRAITITSLDEKFLSKVLAVIEAHMDDEHFSIEELSREANLSSMHFYRKIKGLTGQTPSAFLRMIRLKRAAELLAKNSDNVTQIAYSVGFSSLSYFNKCFKEHFGVTPGQYAHDNHPSATR